MFFWSLDRPRAAVDRCTEVAELDKRVEDRGVGDGVEHAGSTWRGNGSTFHYTTVDLGVYLHPSLKVCN